MTVPPGCTDSRWGWPTRRFAIWMMSGQGSGMGASVRVVRPSFTDSPAWSSPRPQPLRHPGDLTFGAAMQLGHLADGGTGLEHGVDSDHGNVVAPERLEHPLEHPIPLVPGEIHVEVGRVLPVLVEEPLEHQVGADRVHVGDAQQVAE